MKSQWTDRRSLGALVLIFIVSAFTLSRLYKQTVTMYSVGDDDFYWAYARRVVYNQNVDFSKEPLPTFQANPGMLNFASPFPGLLWVPSTVLGCLVTPIIAHLPLSTPETLASGTTLYHRLLVSAYSASLSLAGLFFLYFVLRRFVNAPSALYGCVLVLLGTPLFYFTFRRPLMSHSSELFTLGAFALTSLRFAERPQWRLALLMGFTAALASGVRYPNVFIVMSWALAVAVRYPSIRRGVLPYIPLILLGLVVPLVVQLGLWKNLWGTWIPTKGVYSMKFSNLSHHLRLDAGTMKRMIEVTVGPGWGLLWMESAVLFAMASTLCERTANGRFIRLLALGCVPLFMIAANYFSQGGSYGFRYLLAKVLWLSLGVSLFYERYAGRRWVGWLLGSSLIFPIIASLLFESGPETLTLQVTPLDWLNDTFMLEVLKTILHNPMQLVFAWTGTPIGHFGLLLLDYAGILQQFPAAIQAKAVERLTTIPISGAVWYLAWMVIFTVFWGWLVTIFSERSRASHQTS